MYQETTASDAPALARPSVQECIGGLAGEDSPRPKESSGVKDSEGLAGGAEGWMAVLARLRQANDAVLRRTNEQVIPLC
jgi:hypothetical protein